MTTKEAVGEFLKDLEQEGRSPHTVAAYRRDLGVFTRFVGTLAIDAVTPSTLTAFMAHQSVQIGPCGARRAKATINRFRVSLKALFAWAGARWIITRNPTAILKCRRYRGLPPTILSENEIRTVLGYEFTGRHAERDRAIITFLLLTGCRLSETVALNTEDVDLTAGMITLTSTKGGDPDRIPLHPVALEALKPLVQEGKGKPLWTTSSGGRISGRQMQRIVASRMAEAGISKTVSPHTLRHTVATRLYNQTRDIRLVQKALRHEHVTTTEVYAQVDPKRLELAVEHGILPEFSPLGSE